jgi:hypothetical protein
MKNSATEPELVLFARNVLKIHAGIQGSNINAYVEAITNAS